MPGDRGRLLGFDLVASHPAAADARAYFDAWIEFYRPFYQFPADLPVEIDHGFDTYKVTYCTVDDGWVPTVATGNLSVPRRAVLGSLRVRRSDELFTFGFSQGGHAVLALHRALERRGVEVTATAPVGGVFDVERFFLSSLVNTTTVTLPLSVAYLLLAYDDIYAVDRWRPDAPIRVYHSPVDEEVPFEDMLVSVHRLRKRGADVTVERLAGFDHVNSWIQAMPRAVRWFRTLEV